MKKFLMCLLVCSMATVMFAAEEQIVNLPQDQNKYYISVVGEKGQAYDNLLAQFEQGKLKELKSQVHFCPVTTDKAIFAERYKPSIKGLPTVRVQEADGAVVYEAARNIKAGDALYYEIASAIQRRQLLPWRRNHAHPQPSPQPQPKPIFVDPAPQPLNDGGAPVVAPVDESVNIGIGICLVMLVIGVIAGEIAASKALHSEEAKNG